MLGEVAQFPNCSPSQRLQPKKTWTETPSGSLAAFMHFVRAEIEGEAHADSAGCAAHRRPDGQKRQMWSSLLTICEYTF